MTIALLVITDGRKDCITRTIPSALEQLDDRLVTERWIYDDSGDSAHRAWLADTFPRFQLVWHPAGRQGFGGAIREAWHILRARSNEPFVFHLEDDFTFNRTVDLPAMLGVLVDHPHLVQLALRRQPWNPQECAAGGIVEQHPHDYIDRTDGTNHWLEHRRFFTTNPSLYRRSLCHEGWPDVEHSEGHFGIDLLAKHPDWRFGFWGARDSGEWVTHIGHQRNGTGY